MKAKTPYQLAGLMLSLAFLSANPTTAVAASAEIQNLNPREQAQVARHKILQRKQKLNAQNESAGGDGECGSVNIGNQEDDSARGRINPRDTTVIITGNIFNTANCR